MSSLPACVHPHLEQQLDWDHEGVLVEKDLTAIADHMTVKISTHLGLTAIDIHEIRAISPLLQRYT